MKYNIRFVGLYDYDGVAIGHNKYIEWMTENCGGRWRYDSPNAKLASEHGKPDDWPTFYKMIFSFTHKRDYERFKKTFT